MTDDLDMRIITELARDARQTHTTLSRKIGVSDRRRINQLRANNVIMNTVIPNASKLGYEIIAMIVLKVDIGHIEEIEQQLVNFINIRYVADCTGRYDIIMGAWVSSSKELQNFIKVRLVKIAGIKESETFIVMDVEKNEIDWLQNIKGPQ